MRRAEWKSLPRDPGLPLAWWWRGARLSVLGAAAWLLILLALVVTVPLFEFFAVIVSGLFLWSAVVIFLVRKWREGPWAVADLAPSPAPAEAFPVEFSLFSEGLCTGRDQGIASFVEGWLHVEGLRTTFSVRPLDTLRIGHSRAGFDQFELPGGQRIELRPLANSSTDRATFYETVRVWHRFTVAPPLGEPLLPPIRVHASAAAVLFTTLATALTGLVALLAFVLYVLVLHPSATGSLLPVVVVSGAICARYAQRARRDLQRLSTLRQAVLGSGSGMLEGERY